MLATLSLVFFAAFINKDFMGIKTVHSVENWEHSAYHGFLFGDDNCVMKNRTMLIHMESKLLT